jgi:hypothetical protein
MNVRKLLDWRKLLIYSHRWMGIGFGLLFCSWFISGVAFMYWGMPEVTAEERFAHQADVNLSTATLSPAEAAEKAEVRPQYATRPAEAAEKAEVRPGGLRIEMRGSRPVYRIGNFPVYADTGEPVQTPVNELQAMEIIRKWDPEHTAGITYDARLEDSDQWTLQSAQRNQMPLHRIALNDSADTYYYVAEETGEIAMKTDRETRIKGFLSGVLHWVYFIPLRKQTFWWNQFIIWGSFVGALMCLTGIVAGIWRLSPTRRFRQKGQQSFTPYSGLMRWHHYSGLIFGLISFTFIMSGAFSVNPYNMFSGTPLSREQREVATGGAVSLKPITLDALRSGIAEISKVFPVKEVDVMRFRGDLYLSANRPLSTTEHRMVSLASPEKGAFTKFDDSVMETIAKETMPNVPVEESVWLTEYDNYYRSRDNARALPVLRVKYLDPQRTWLYLDPQHGTVSKQERITRLNRWLYAGLHDLDLPYIFNRRPLWDITVIVLSIGGLLLSATTLWPMCTRLARHGRRLMNVFRPSRATRRRVNRVEAD